MRLKNRLAGSGGYWSTRVVRFNTFMIKLDCLRDCDAACCKPQRNHRVIFDFGEPEVQMFERKGVKLIPQPGGGYAMPEVCVFLRGKLCVLHRKQTQPQCCVDNKAGEDLCLRVRASIVRKRWSEVE